MYVCTFSTCVYECEVLCHYKNGEMKQETQTSQKKHKTATKANSAV